MALNGRIAVIGKFCAVMVSFDAHLDSWRPIGRTDTTSWWLGLVPAAPAVLVIWRDWNTADVGLFAYRPPA